MKKTAALALATLSLLAGTVFAQQPGHYATVGTTNVVLLPASKPQTTNGWWSTTAYSRGDVIVETNKLSIYYWCTVAGTSSNQVPTFGTTNDVSEVGGVTWRMVVPNRKAIMIGHTGFGELSLGLGFPAVAGSGPTLYAGHSYEEDLSSGNVFQGQINAIYNTGSGNVWIQEK